MSNKAKKIASVIGIIIGIAVIILGIVITSSARVYRVGKNIRFGTDFYTEIYDVTQQVGEAVYYVSASLEGAIGWLLIAIGAIDVSVFVYLLVAACSGTAENAENIEYKVGMLVSQMKREAEARAKIEEKEKAKREGEEKAPCDNTAKSAFDAAVQARWEASVKARQNAAERGAQETETVVQNTASAKPKTAKTLKEKLQYALKFSTDDGMIHYLKNIDDEAVQAILNYPSCLVREQIEKLLASM